VAHEIPHTKEARLNFWLIPWLCQRGTQAQVHEADRIGHQKTSHAFWVVNCACRVHKEKSFEARKAVANTGESARMPEIIIGLYLELVGPPVRVACASLLTACVMSCI
jgi:hypothetical protein